MPKPAQLHSKSKGKSKAIQKANNAVDEDGEGGPNDDRDPDEIARFFQLELLWCIQKLEKTLSEKKESEKKLQDAWKVLTTLKNNNKSMIRKRQLMRSYFGNYRDQMQEEDEKKSKTLAKMAISSPSNPHQGRFLKRSAFLQTCDEAFRFNFNLAHDQLDSNPATSEVKQTVDETSGEPQVKINKSETKDSSDAFKFTFSKSEFRFNFGSADS